MTRVLLTAFFAVLFSVASVQAEEQYMDDSTTTTTNSNESPTKAEVVHDVSKIKRGEAKQLWMSLTPDEKKAFAEQGITSFNDLPIEEQRKLVERREEKKSVRGRLVSPREADSYR